MTEDSTSVRYHLFVDEADTPEIFDSKGRINIGKPGCSRIFFLRMLEVDDPQKLREALKTLREQLITDPYFATAESFKTRAQEDLAAAPCQRRPARSARECL